MRRLSLIRGDQPPADPETPAYSLVILDGIKIIMHETPSAMVAAREAGYQGILKAFGDQEVWVDCARVSFVAGLTDEQLAGTVPPASPLPEI